MVLYDIVTDVHPNIRRRTSSEDLIAGDAVYISGEEIVSQTNNASCDGNAFAGIAMDSVASGKVLSIATAPTELYANATGTITVGNYIVPDAAGYVASATEELTEPIIIGYAIKAAADSKCLIKLIDVPTFPIRAAATFIVAASDSLHKERADYVCPGVDDQVVIQAAIDALPTSGGKVVLLDGTYNLSANVTLNDNVHLSGNGAGTILVGRNIYANNVSEITISNLYVKDTVGHCIHLSDVVNGLVKNCIVENAGDDGIAVQGDSTVGVIINANICRNCATSTVPSGIELDMGARNVIITNNICYGNGNIGTSWGGGINLHTHASEPTIKDVTISDNICYNNVNNIWIANPNVHGAIIEKIIISGNIIYDGSISGIETEKLYDSTIENNTFENNELIIDSYSQRISVIGNTFKVSRVSLAGINHLFEANEVYDVGDAGHGVTVASSYSTIVGNVISNSDRAGLRLLAGADKAIVISNIIINNGQARTSHMHGISIDGVTDVIIANNICGDNQGTKTQDYGIYLWGATTDYVIIENNNFRDNAVSGMYQEGDGINLHGKAYNKYSDLFMDVLAVSATHVRSNEDISAATPITFTIDAQPDVPRTLSWAFDTHAQITEYDMEVIGVDAKGNTVTETWDETAGWSGETSNAFATITSIKMTSRTGTGAGDTMDIGITDVLGLSNIIDITSDVYKIKKNNANATVAAAQVNITYDTYDMSVIGLAATDDFTIWYKSNLNIIS